MDEKIDFFKKIPELSFLSEEKLAEISAHAEVKVYMPGELILQEGDVADAYYVVKEGDVRIFTYDLHGKKMVLARFQNGKCFGEQAFSTSASPRRTASAEAISESTLYRIPRKIFIKLDPENNKLRLLLQERFHTYISEKISKSDYKSRVSLEQFKNTKTYEKREVIFHQGDPARHLFFLLYGSVELRKYDEQKILTHCIELGIGEIFGIGALSKEKVYQFTAIAKEPSEVALISIDILQDDKFFPYVMQYGQKLRSQLEMSSLAQTDRRSQMVQFRGQYHDMPVIITILPLKDGRQVVCQQALHSDMKFIKTVDVQPSKTLIKETEAGDSRELLLDGNTLVGLNELGEWEDTDRLLELIIQKREIPEQVLTEFKNTGYFGISACGITIDKTIICNCMRVGRSEITDLIKNGVSTFDEIKAKTKASTVCGSCRPTILELLGGSVWMPYRLSQSAVHNEQVRSFRLTPSAPQTFSYEPGQHITLKVNINNLWVIRSYTLTSTSGDPYFEITVKKEEKGLFSPWLFDSAEQEPLVYAAGPYGDFILKKEKTPIICFAGGIGCTPFIAFIRYLSKHRPDQPIYIEYSTRSAADFVLREELESHLKTMTNATISFRETSKQGRRSEAELHQILHRFPDADIYICGSSNFTISLLEALKKAEIPEQKIHTEYFIPAAGSAPLSTLQAHAT